MASVMPIQIFSEFFYSILFHQGYKGELNCVNLSVRATYKHLTLIENISHITSLTYSFVIFLVKLI